MKRMIFIACALALVAASASAQRTIDDATIKDIQKRSDAFIGLMYQGDYEEAFDFVRAYPRAISNDNLDALEESAAVQLEDIMKVYGQKLEAQYIGFKGISNFLLKFIYVVRYERHLIWWNIIYYKGAEDVWLLSTISYDDDLEELMSLTF